MSKYIKVVAAAVMFAGLGISTGCVSQEKYQEALDANRHLLAEKQSLNTRIEELGVENSDVRNDLDTRQGDIIRLNERLVSCDDSINRLTLTRDTLKKQIEDMITGNTPPVIGDILPPQLNAALRTFAKANPELVDFQQGRGMIKLKSDLTFALGKDRVTPAARAALLKFAEILTSPAANGFHIYVAGHTDNVPIKKTSPTSKSHPDNWYLSVHRAVAVEQILVHIAKISPTRIGVMGFGEYHPVEPNEVYVSGAGKGGNAKNRRVELWIVPPGRFLTSGATKTDKDASDK